MRMKSLKNVCRKDNENIMHGNVKQLFFFFLLCGIFRTFYIKTFTSVVQLKNTYRSAQSCGRRFTFTRVMTAGRKSG